MITPWYRPLIDRMAPTLSLDPDLVEAITWQESSGTPSAFRFEPMFYTNYIKGKAQWSHISDPKRVASSYGLMQVMYTTAVQEGFLQEPEYLFVVPINLQFGCRHLKHLMEWSNGQIWKAVSAYNGGKGNWNSPQAQHYAADLRTWFDKIRQRV